MDWMKTACKKVRNKCAHSSVHPFRLHSLAADFSNRCCESKWHIVRIDYAEIERTAAVHGLGRMQNSESLLQAFFCDAASLLGYERERAVAAATVAAVGAKTGICLAKQRTSSEPQTTLFSPSTLSTHRRCRFCCR